MHMRKHNGEKPFRCEICMMRFTQKGSLKTMSATTMDWRHEMHQMLSEFERQTTVSLGKIEMAFKYSGLSLNDHFKQYFMRASNNRIEETYDQFEINSMLKDRVQFDVHQNMMRTNGPVEVIDSSAEEDQTGNPVELESPETVFGIQSDGYDKPPELNDDFETEYDRNTDDVPNMNPKSINWQKNKQNCIEKEIDNVMKAGEEIDDVIPSTAFNGHRIQDIRHECTITSNNGTESNHKAVTFDNRKTGVSSRLPRAEAESTPESLTKKKPANQLKIQKRFHCKVCEYSSNRKWNFNVHMRTHSGVKQYRCDICPKAFTSMQNLKNHKMAHTEQVPFHCRGCLSGFPQKAGRDAHEKVCKKRRYECHICKKFNNLNKNHLEMHMRKHNSEKPFRCEICMKRFTKKYGLKRHLNTIHPE
ncbi:zinc finger protein 84-like [Contarinia nasturtii]|uniref:zinc finger protein 84-like n=1 Tax=Contarinia nasturtii TaxID=265458 RepID=UPI0012D3EE7F|nr:zinc finger protein 84-like [Contarinia nasturtii]